jgi:hypothetical protein
MNYLNNIPISYISHIDLNVGKSNHISFNIFVTEFENEIAELEYYDEMFLETLIKGKSENTVLKPYVEYFRINSETFP